MGRLVFDVCSDVLGSLPLGIVLLIHQLSE